MSEPDAVPLPREGEVFFDVRGEARTMRLSWYADSAVAVFSIWQGNRCIGTFRLPFVDLVRMVETLQSGPPSRTPDAVSGHSADPSFTTASHDRGYGYGEPTGYLPAAAYGHQQGYESGRGYESAHAYESGPGYESGPRHGSEPIYGARPAYRSGPGYGGGPDYPDAGPPGYDPPGYGDTQRQLPGGPGSQAAPYQGYADQAGYPDSAGYPRTGEYAGPAGRQPVASTRHAEWMAAPAYRTDSSSLEFPSALPSADNETSDWDAATASYRAP